ncbi:MAG: hypothetical protein FJY10_12100, partial [Bacteroidetes bacterium]|nr:hypothetical protein [Bacteroidota bacterium]
TAVKAGVALLKESHGLVPAISLQKKNPVKNPRSTMATYTGLYDIYRLMFNRLGKRADDELRPLSTAFSFNNEEGACPACKGLGSLTVCDENRLITNPEKSLTSGALDGSKTGKFYGESHGQYVATLLTVGQKLGIDYSVSYKDLDENARNIAMNGCGEDVFNVDWHYKRGAHEGVHHLQTTWPGFLKLVETEYHRKHADARGEAMLALMKVVACEHCQGFRLKPERQRHMIRGLHIGQVAAMSADEVVKWFEDVFPEAFEEELEKKAAEMFRLSIMAHLEALQKTGLGHLSAGRMLKTLSTGELQRLKLVTGLSSSVSNNILYLLDEPTGGLHPRDIKQLLNLFNDLTEAGNTLVCITHEPMLMTAASKIIELGPKGGTKGGWIVEETHL